MAGLALRAGLPLATVPKFFSTNDLLPRGVTVAQQVLVLFVKVQILSG